MMSSTLTLYVILPTILTIETNLLRKQDVCDMKRFDQCVANYFIVFNGTTKVAESEEDLHMWCRVQLPREDKCMKDYTNKCMKPFLRQCWTIMRYTVTQIYKAKCDSNLSDGRLYSIGKCWNPKKHVFLKTCYVELMDHLIEIKKFKNNKLKLASVCCRYWNMFQCLTNLVREDASKNGSLCTSDHVTEVDSVGKSLASHFLIRLCGNQYVDGSDECRKLLATQNRVRHGAVKWKSPAKYFSEIIDSI